jgi:type IV pilus assembly protein PilM
MKQKLAIDIGNRNIKLLVGNNKKIFHNATIETPLEAIEDNKIVDIEKVYKAINDYILRNSIKAKSVCFSIHGQDVVVRHIEVPIMEKKSLGNTVEWEINQYLPENGTNHYLDYEIVDKENTAEKKVYKLLTVAAPKEKVDSYVELAEKLELKIEAVDIAANCVARVFANSVKNGKEFRSIGIIDIGTKSSSIVVMD